MPECFDTPEEVPVSPESEENLNQILEQVKNFPGAYKHSQRVLVAMNDLVQMMIDQTEFSLRHMYQYSLEQPSNEETLQFLEGEICGFCSGVYSILKHLRCLELDGVRFRRL